MRYPGDRHVLPLFGPWRWAPYMRGKFYWKKYQNTRSFFLSHTSKLYQHKQWNVVPKGTAKIDPSNKYNIFPSFIIDQSWNTLQLKNIVLSFHPPFEPITALLNIYRSVTLLVKMSICMLMPLIPDISISTYIEYAWILTFLTRIVWPRITRNVLRGETGPDGQNIFGHTDVLINDKYFLWTPILVRFKTINKDNSYFYKKHSVIFWHGCCITLIWYLGNVDKQNIHFAKTTKVNNSTYSIIHESWQWCNVKQEECIDVKQGTRLYLKLTSISFIVIIKEAKMYSILLLSLNKIVKAKVIVHAFN